MEPLKLTDFSSKDDYINYLSTAFYELKNEHETLRKYVEYIAESLDKSIKYTEYIAKDIDTRHRSIIEFIECSNNYKLTYDEFEKNKDVVKLDSKINSLIQ
jgi:hypothetical protein